MPIDKECFSPDEIDQSASISQESSIREEPLSEHQASESDAKDTTILIVEDNEELLSLMADILSRNYSVFTARDGMEAIEIMKDNKTDVVISDVMMPRMDGLELCRTLKGDIETSHTRVILLTAMNSSDDRVACYNAGADGYIAKPFELKVLEARICNLVAANEERQRKFKSDENLDIKVLDYPSRDGEFLEKILRIIEEHLSDSNFDIDEFADVLHLSRSTLYRKLKTMTGLSPMEFIRNIRLKHACTMLNGGSMSISEIAYSVGFSDPNYFALCFKTEFGNTPTDYRKNSRCP
jgi:YesN/AraC family two-component response regulator